MLTGNKTQKCNPITAGLDKWKDMIELSQFIIENFATSACITLRTLRLNGTQMTQITMMNNDKYKKNAFNLI